jgi:hypothetical protein
LIESNGCIVVPKSFRSPKGKIYYPSIQVVFNIKDYPLAAMIKLIIGHGSIRKYEDRGACVLVINNAQGIQAVVNVINGKMRTSTGESNERFMPKIAQTFEGSLTHRDRGAIKSSSYVVTIGKRSSNLTCHSIFFSFPFIFY